MWLKILLVGVGGSAGAIARYLLSGWVFRLTGDHWFPYGTLVVNILGCITLGFLVGIGESRGVLSPDARLFLLIGVLGSFTTFSTFGYESLQLLRVEMFVPAMANIVLSVAVGIAAVWAGGVLAKLI